MVTQPLTRKQQVRFIILIQIAIHCRSYLFTISLSFPLLPFSQSQYFSRHFLYTEPISHVVENKGRSKLPSSESTATAATHAHRNQDHSGPSKEGADEHHPHAVPKADRDVDELPAVLLGDDDESKVRNECDGGDDRRRDGQHKGDDPGRFVVHTARYDGRDERQKREAGGDWVHHEQDGKTFDNDVPLSRLSVRQVPEGVRINRVPELWTEAIRTIHRTEIG